MKVISTSYPEPGTTKFSPIDSKVARKIADYFYNVLNLWTCVDDVAQNSVAGTYCVQITAGYVAIIGMVNNQPAILHKFNGGRELNILSLN